jgi:transcription initiation factor TFIIH subunit 1
MSPPSGAASYKKKDGILAISADEQTVSWSPTAADTAKKVTIIVANITSMQFVSTRLMVLLGSNL